MNIMLEDVSVMLISLVQETSIFYIQPTKNVTDSSGFMNIGNKAH